MITITVRKHLAKKLRPVFAMLHRLEGVPKPSNIPKQGGDQRKKTSANPTTSVHLSIKSESEPKGRDKLFFEEPIVNKNNEEELKRRKACESELDEKQRIVREAEAKEKAERGARSTLESRKLLFPVWTIKRIQSQAIDSPNQYWLEPVVSFEIQNTQDSQLDLPFTSKAFKFHSFIKVANVPISDSGADQLFLQLYLQHMRPQYKTWSANKIMAVKVTRPIETDSFPNAKFKFFRGSTSQVHEFTLADLLCINPYDWIILYHLLLRDTKKYVLD
ncbi:unnamed protein product [Lactuca saligna]|uniref:Uncharacterized protein n=1 Tax=Lactuca saligna TaxID=75948 RepID=A0AA36A0T9_LACSI|nr:unnamed protein product [Lactuca saligna]